MTIQEVFFSPRLLSDKPGDVTVHMLDLDLLLVDHVSPTTLTKRFRADLLRHTGINSRGPVLGGEPRV